MPASLPRAVVAGLVVFVSAPVLAYPDLEDVGQSDAFDQVGTWEPTHPAVAPTPQAFERELTPYGRWLSVHDVGRVWQPYSSVVGDDFVPYTTGGTWMHTSLGWSFRSSYNWGWAPFHYGRWHLASGYGWVWQPGFTWSPAWVTWRSSPSHLAWAPMPPAGVQLSFGWDAPCWSFVEQRDFGRPQVSRYVVPSWKRRGAMPVPRDTWRASPPVWRGRNAHPGAPAGVREYRHVNGASPRAMAVPTRNAPARFHGRGHGPRR